MASKQNHIIERREGSIKRMEEQLKSGKRTLSTRTAKKLGSKYKQGDVVPLTDNDIKRIKLVIKQTEAHLPGGKRRKEV